MATPELIAAVNLVIEEYQEVIGEYASRTNQIIERYGYIDALSRIVQNPDLQSGFRTLRDLGRLDITFEAIILRFREEFDDAIVEAAQWRLDNADNLM